MSDEYDIRFLCGTMLQTASTSNLILLMTPTVANDPYRCMRASSILMIVEGVVPAVVPATAPLRVQRAERAAMALAMPRSSSLAPELRPPPRPPAPPPPPLKNKEDKVRQQYLRRHPPLRGDQGISSLRAHSSLHLDNQQDKYQTAQ